MTINEKLGNSVTSNFFSTMGLDWSIVFKNFFPKKINLLNLIHGGIEPSDFAKR